MTCCLNYFAERQSCFILRELQTLYMKIIFILTVSLFHICLVCIPAQTNAQSKVPAFKYGKYGCTSTVYKGGFYDYTSRGSFVLGKDGSYTYLGLQKQSTGKFTVDTKGNLLFKGGYFDGGTAERIDRPNKFFLVFPGIPGNRWTCSWVSN